VGSPNGFHPDSADVFFSRFPRKGDDFSQGEKTPGCLETAHWEDDHAKAREPRARISRVQWDHFALLGRSTTSSPLAKTLSMYPT